MRRWFLLMLGGIGASAAAVVLLPGTAHALGPKVGSVAIPVVAPAPATPSVLPTAALPTVPLPTVPRVPAPATPVVVVRTVVAHVVDGVRTELPAITVHAPVAVPSLTVISHSTHAVVPAAPLPPHRSRTRVAQTPMFDTDSHMRTTHTTMTATRPSQSSRTGAMLAGLLVPSTGTAVTPAKPSFSTPFVSGDAPAFAPGVASTRVSSPTGDRTRPGFLVGSARPG
jgi:hypothetical protein